jgi:hypothetical protein
LAAHRTNRIRTNVFRNRTTVFFVDVAMFGFGSLSAKLGWRPGKVSMRFPKRLWETRGFVVSS